MRGSRHHARKALALASCAGLALIGGNAWGQTAAPASPPKAGETELGELVVTALRRDTKLQDAPAAISALNAERLERMGASSFSDYYRTVPSLQITTNAGSPGQSRITLRGIYAAGEPTVGLYYGETSVEGPSGNTSDGGLQSPNINLFDVSRVEVLRGPQGTLYGSGSVGGTIRVLFNEPDSTQFGGKIAAQGSTTDHGGEGYYLRGAINIPLITDKLAVRGVAYKEGLPGYVDNIRYNDKDVNKGSIWGGRLMLKYTPTDNIDFTATALHQESHLDDNSSWYQSFGEHAYRSDQAVRTPFDDNMSLYSGVLNWNTPIGKLTAVSSYYRWKFIRNIDPTASLNAAVVLGSTAPLCGPFTHVATCTPAQQAAYRSAMLATLPTAFHAVLGVQSATQEIRLASPGGQWLDWTLGLFYEDRKDKITSLTAQADPKTGYILDPLVTNGATFTGTDLTQLSEFAEVSVHPIDRLTVTGGARHYRYDKTVTGQVLQTSFLTGSFAGAATSREAKASGWVGKVNLSYKATDDILAYVQWAQGFRPGGANNVPGLSTVLAVYQPDSLDSYEAGLKTSWSGGRYTLNLSAFQIDWSGIQSTLTVFPAFRVVTNAGEAKIRGLEIEAAAHPLQGLRLNAALSYIPEAKLTKGQLGAAIVSGTQNGLPGDRLPYTAKLTGSVSAEYGWDIGHGLTAVVHSDANYHGVSANEFRPTYAFYEKLPAFTEVNARVGVQGPDWSAFLFVNNLTESVGALAVQSSIAVPPYQWDRQLSTLAPRTVGVTLNKDF